MLKNLLCNLKPDDNQTEMIQYQNWKKRSDLVLSPRKNHQHENILKVQKKHSSCRIAYFSIMFIILLDEEGSHFNGAACKGGDIFNYTSGINKVLS